VTVPLPRVRIRFSKHGKVRFVSHRDLARIWERAMRRAEVPIAYSEGFSPRPRLSFGLALPTGYESDGEYLDAVLRHEIVVDDDLLARLSAGLPVGVEAVAAASLPTGSDSLQQAVVATHWSLEVIGAGTDELRTAVDRLWSASTHMVTRTRKAKTVTDDLRPAVLALDVVDAELSETGVSAPVVEAELATLERSVRPAELIEALAGLVDRELTDHNRAIDGAWRIGRARRRTQWIERDGRRREPLELARSLAPHAPERAS
jgi:radical SAM-linked protein